MKKWKPDVIVAATSALDMALEAGARSGTPVVLLVRAFEHADTTKSVYGTLRTAVKRLLWGDYSVKRFTECALVVYNSKYLAQWYCERVGWHNYGVVYPPLDVVGSSETWSGRTDRVLMVGTSAQKGIDVVLEVAERDPSRSYIVAGGNPGRWTEGAPPNVCFVGWQDDRAALYGSADVVIMPSRWEAFGRVAVEALRHGKAVLVSDKGGLPEAVGDTEALIVGSLDAEDWIDRLNWLETNTTEARVAIESARDMTARFVAEAQLAEFEALLEGVVG